MSTVSESNPWWAITSAENELGTDSQPFTTASPRAQIFLSVFSLTTLSCAIGEGAPLRELRTAHDAEVAPPADTQVFGLLEVVDRGDVGRGIRQVGFHRAHREAELLLDGLEPLVAPRELRHFRLAQVRLEQIDLRGRNAEHLGGVEGVAAQLERGAVGSRAAGLPVDERQPPVVGPETEVGRHPHGSALELEHLRPVLDRPV